MRGGVGAYPALAHLRTLEGFGSIKAARQALYTAHEHSPEAASKALWVRAEIAHARRGRETGRSRTLPVCDDSFAGARRVGGTGSLGFLLFVVAGSLRMCAAIDR